MNVLIKPRMTVDEFLAWAADHPGRYELFRGEVFPMSPEAVRHTEVKGAVYVALVMGAKKAGMICHVLTDGPTVRVDQDTAYEPDALVYCGEKASESSLEISNPIILVEVTSPTTRRVDVSRKLADYFRLPSVVHYLVIDPSERSIVHHARATGDAILTRIITEGVIALDPPGIQLALDDIYAA